MADLQGPRLMAVGDVNSSARGSGARYNDGKPDLSLIPLTLLAGTLPSAPAADAEHGREMQVARAVLLQLGRYQLTQDIRQLDVALTMLAPWWEDCARVFEYGRNKYASWNWAKGMAWSIPIACAGRHAMKIIRNGQRTDDESTRRHLGHIMANLVMIRTFVETFPEGNDLPDPNLFRAPTKPEEGPLQ